MGRKGSNDSSMVEDENTEEEDNRNRAITFLMSAAEKRAFEVRKRHEKTFNERFKKIFTAVVSTYLACQDRSNKVIDMTEDLTLQLEQRIDSEDHQLKTPKTPPCPINGEQLSIENIETIEEEKEALPQPTLIPKPLMRYEKFAEIKAKED